MKSKQIALIGVFAALYYVLGIVFQPIGFMLIQCRVACALIPLIALFGYPATIGITIGHLLFNLNSPLGTLDYLSPFIFLIPRYLIQRYGTIAIPIHTLSVGAWVGYLLMTQLPPEFRPYSFTVAFLTVTIGETVAEWFLGYVLIVPLIKRRITP